MRFRFLAISLIATSFFADAADPRLQFDPAQPRQGQLFTVTFDPKGGPLEKSQSITLIYGWSPGQWDRTPMKRNGTRFSAEIRAGAPYMWCWVEDPASGEKDTNHGGPWDTYFYDEKGFPIKAARQGRAEMYMLRGQPNEKNDVALALLEEELRAFPSNGFARGEWWGLRFQEAGPDSQKQERDRIAHEISVYLDSNLDKPSAYLAATDGYQRIGRPEQGKEALHAFFNRFPDDDSLDYKVLSNFMLSYFQLFHDTAGLEALPHIPKGWVGGSYWAMLFGAYKMNDAPAEKLHYAGEHWLETLNANDAGTRITIAESWLAKGVDPAAAERLAREGVNLAESDAKFLPNSSPNPWTEKTMVTRIYRSTLGWALFQQQRYDEALRELQRAVDYGEKEHIRMSDVYYRLGRTLEKLNRPDEAMEAYIKETALGNGPQVPAWNAAAAIFSKQHGGIEGFQTFLRSRANDFAVAASASGPFDEMNEKVARFALRGPDGKTVQLSQYLGKAVIVDFWATWCGPCLPALENTRALARRFPGKVVVLAVSTDSEETRDRAQKFLTDRGFDFTLLFDDEHNRDLQYVGIPTRFLIDPSGQVRIRELGSAPYQDLLFDERLRSLLTAQQ